MFLRTIFALSLLALGNASFAQTAATPSVLPRPDFHFQGNVGRTYKDSDLRNSRSRCRRRKVRRTSR